MDIEFFKGKKIFITGHTGFKGSWLCKLLVGVGAIVRGYSLSSEKSLFNLFKLDDCVDSIYGDVRDYDKLKISILEFQPEIIIHMAAQAIEKAENEYEKFRIKQDREYISSMDEMYKKYLDESKK